MPKNLVVDPAITRHPGIVPFQPLAVNAYDVPIEDEVARLGRDALLSMLRDMMLIREFESMLDGFKRAGRYHGVRYNHLGPAHLSIGQEAAAVGQAFLLGSDDHIFGSHRSHAEIIAKGLSAIARGDDPWLQSVMEHYLDGRILLQLDRYLPAPDVRTRAIQFLLYGLLAEIFGRRHGFNQGMGGSMHAFFPPFGIYPNNAIVGGSAGIAVGAALAKRLRGDRAIVIANIGDGATGCGPVWEAMNFAAMRQLTTLWEADYRGGLSVMFCFMNNFYAMGGQTAGETMSFDWLSRIGAAFNEHNLHAETIDGNNPLAVVDAVRRKRAVLLAGEGPVLLDIQCYRQSGHSPSDASSYRSREEFEAWRAMDPIEEFARHLEGGGVLGPGDREGMAEWAERRVDEIVELAVDLDISPRLDVEADPDAIARLMFSNETSEPSSRVSRDLLMPVEESPRTRQIAGLSRRGRGGSGAPVSMRDVLFEAIAHHAAHDESLVIYGEENRDWGGAFGVYRGLTEILPYRRLFNAPISEAAIVATAVGCALEGGRALVELMYSDFMGRAGDEIFNQLAKWQAMSGGVLRMPVVVRVSVGNKYGAQHSQEWSALVAHVPGLKVVFPATPYDAKGLMASALSGSDPVVFFESQRLYDVGERFRDEGVPEGYFRIPIGAADVKRLGTDLTIVSFGATLYRVVDAADRLESEFGLQVEIVDARSLVPFDYETVLTSVRKTGRLLLTSDAVERGSFLATIAANVQRFAFDDLDAPIAIVGARNWITPPTEMEEVYLPQPERLIDAVHTVLRPLPGYTPHSRCDVEEQIRRARLGV